MPVPSPNEELAAALAHAAAAAGGARDPWWIIGSAAAFLHGARTPVADIDLLMSPCDALAVLDPEDIAASGGRGSDLFRSEVFGTICGTDLRIEVFGGFHLRAGEHWRPVVLETRVAVMVGGCTVWVPARDELAALFRSFGRPKDLARAALLEGLAGG
ncbi:MAG TPA: hypothetical protein VGC56_09965 [Allosphingosinicella sp.]|jgi:hypothetical protein